MSCSLYHDRTKSSLGRRRSPAGSLSNLRCFMEMHEPTAAHADLDRAWPLLERMSGATMFAGVQSALAEWWEVTASLLCLDSDFAGAADALRKAVEFRRLVTQLPQLEVPYKIRLPREYPRQVGTGALSDGRRRRSGGSVP